ncbi:glycerol kinase GlpK [Paenibacillus ihumii]|uniref:glycerol kinase GlpK n=1 Tax=Paenibacillus ihumii TaxID=687436 RepID=UPI0006D79F59|nr:glycerol kinase GlpK [Paenibacillus ihumii]
MTNKQEYLLTIDQSTSGTKALIIDSAGAIIAKSSVEHKQYYPSPGWVEHDPMEIHENVLRASEAVLQQAGIEPSRLAALTLTNQRETAVMWDRATGLPVCNAIVWQCQRTAERCEALKAAGYEEIVRAKTGLMLDPYFSAAKWRWMLEQVPYIDRLLEEGRLLAGTMDSWLLWKLSGGAVHATDYTNASRTSLFNIHELRWDTELCELFGVPIELLPEVKSSDAVFGVTNAKDSQLLSYPIPIAGIIGDSQAALFGQHCFETGMAKATYGTGTSVLMNIGEKPVAAENGLVLAIGWSIGGKATYALEAVIRASGDTIKWVRDNLGLFRSYDELEELLLQSRHNEGVYLVPAFVGLGAPYWEPQARAMISGMSRGTGRPQIIRAAMESIAYQVRDAIALIEEETGIPLTMLRADGGASDNAILMQFQADMLGCGVSKSDMAELSAMGSAYLGGLGIGLWASLGEITKQQRGYKLYVPQMDPAQRMQNYEGWKRAIAAVLQDRGAASPSHPSQA